MKTTISAIGYTIAVILMAALFTFVIINPLMVLYYIAIGFRIFVWCLIIVFLCSMFYTYMMKDVIEKHKQQEN